MKNLGIAVIKECIKQLENTLSDTMSPVEADRKVKEVAELLYAIVSIYEKNK